jgi:methanethiol S-methyltransferase
MTILFGILLFSVIHSLLAGQNIKTAIRTRVGERAYHGFYRLTYNLLAVMTIAPMLWLVVVDAGSQVWSVDHPTLKAMLTSIQLIGTLGVLVSLVQIDIGQFSGLSQAWAFLQEKPLPLPSEPLQTKGLYRLVRHPLYLFSLLTLWPVAQITVTQFLFNLGVTLYFIFGSLVEEQRMLKAFGPAYRQYRAHVPWLIPFLSPRSHEIKLEKGA